MSRFNEIGCCKPCSGTSRRLGSIPGFVGTMQGLLWPTGWVHLRGEVYVHEA